MLASTSRVLRGVIAPVPLAVLLIITAVAGVVFVVLRQVADEQERRLLQERANEAALLVTSSVGSVDAALRTLATVGDIGGSGIGPTFDRLVQPELTGSTTAIGLATPSGDGYTVTAAVGDGARPGEPLDDARGTLLARAASQAEPALVTGLIRDGSAEHAVFARSAGGDTVAYRESLVNAGPFSPADGSPFSELRVALYAAPDVDPDSVVLTTEPQLPIPDDTGVIRQPIAVGADTWLLSVAPRESLSGSFTAILPWFALLGGLLTGLLAAIVASTIAQRHEYATRLVNERTRDLEQALADLGETRAFLDQLLNSGPTVVSRIALPERRITYVSPNSERLLGFTREYAESPHELGSRIEAADRSIFLDALDRVATGTSALETCTYRMKRDGESRWVEATLAAETDADGTVSGVLVYVVDADDRHRADYVRREAQEAAEAANRSKSQFLSRMSHELRTPLNSVLGFGQMLELEDLTAEQRDSVEHILKGGNHLLNLINEVLDISRIEAGELALSPEAVLASEIVDDAVSLIRPLAEQRGVSLHVDSEACACYVFADHQRAKQVLINLLSNSVKYNRPHGSVLVSCTRQDSRLRIDVTDTGVGIAAERLDLLFTPFERLGAERSGEEGTGIGLALSKRLTEAMAGTISATSVLGQGSTFSLDLPQVEAPVDRFERLGGPMVAVPLRATGRHVVLHVEDNTANVTLVDRILSTRADVEVITAMHGRLALDLARQHHPAMVLLDLHLPDMPGEQVLARLRDDPATASVPVVIVSADATPGQVQRLLSAGAAAYLTKPIDVRELLRLVGEAVDGT